MPKRVFRDTCPYTMIKQPNAQNSKTNVMYPSDMLCTVPQQDRLETMHGRGSCHASSGLPPNLATASLQVIIWTMSIRHLRYRNAWREQDAYIPLCLYPKAQQPGR